MLCPLVTLSYIAHFTYPTRFALMGSLWRISGEFGKSSDGNFLLDQNVDRLSVLTEENEDNMTDYQRTIQSLRQQHALLRGIQALIYFNRQLVNHNPQAMRNSMGKETRTFQYPTLAIRYFAMA